MSGGDSSGGNSGGAVKIGIQWNRLIRPDGSQFKLGNAQTADAQGRSGAIGYLDQQLLKRYSMPLLTTAFESTVAYLTATGEGESTAENGSSTESARSQAAKDARRSFIDKMDQIFDEIIQMKAQIRAVTYIPAGTRIIIFPNEDLWLNSETRSQEENLGDKASPVKKPLADEANGNDSQVVYEGNVQENVQPVSSGSRSSSSLVSGGGVTPRPQVQVPPSTTAQQNTTSGSGSDDIPDLL
jgi:hypothetical protein